MSKTLGENRVRIDFNLSGSKEVDEIKKKSAELINLVDKVKTKYLEDNGEASVIPGELVRLISLAQTAYEEAAMWAVKASTFGL